MEREFEQFTEKVVFAVATAIANADEYARCKGDTNLVLKDWKPSDIDANGITLSAEYNDACNCHPEYNTVETGIPWETIEQMMLGQDWRTPALAEGERLRKLAQQAEDERKRQAEARAKEAIEKRDRAEYEKLKAKFEGTA